MAHEEISFCELRSKDIVNELDGRKLGKVNDIVFSPRTGCIMGIVAPYNRRGFFFRGQEIYIPYKNILKIGPDVVLVRLTPDLSSAGSCVNLKTEPFAEPKPIHKEERCEGECRVKKDAECDYKCEKCMLFDCAKRWKGEAYVDGKLQH